MLFKNNKVMSKSKCVYLIKRKRKKCSRLLGPFINYVAQENEGGGVYKGFMVNAL